MPTFATIDDVKVYAPAVSDADENKVDVLLGRAEDLLTIEVPDLAARVADGRIPLARVVGIEAEMVAAVMNNPKALQSESRTVGGLSSSYTVNLEAASGLVRVTRAQRALIRGVTQGTGGGAAFTIRPAAGPARLGPA